MVNDNEELRKKSYFYTQKPKEIARETGFWMPKLQMLEAELKFLEKNL